MSVVARMSGPAAPKPQEALGQNAKEQALCQHVRLNPKLTKWDDAWNAARFQLEEAAVMRYELSDSEWSAIRVMLPNKPRGVARVDDRRVLNGIFWVLRSGAPWRDLPDIYGPARPATIASFVGGERASGTRIMSACRCS